MRSRLGTSVGVLVLAASLASCSGDDDGTTAPAPSPSVPSATASPTGTPLNPVDFWKANPDLAPDGVENDTLLVQQQAKGPQSIPVTGAGGYSKLRLVITCATVSPFEVEVATPTEPRWSGFSGESCDSENIKSAQTPPLPASGVSAVSVKVDPQTDYFITVYGSS